MILTCPECASRYFVSDGSIGAAGRTVRCSACGARWTAHAEAPEAPPPPDPPAFEPAVQFEPEPAGEPLPRAFRERAATRQKVREAAAAGMVWAGVLAGLLLLIGAVVVLRQDIARLWPRTAGAYAMIGLPVNLVGLTIENQHAQPQLQDGHAALVISGSLRNIRDRPVAAPPLRISLLNHDGKPLAIRINDPGGARIPPGEARRFVVDMLDPPAGATDVDITFVLDRPARAAAPVAAPAARLSLRGPDVAAAPAAQAPIAPISGAPTREARPLPQTSPYALPPGGNSSADPRG